MSLKRIALAVIAVAAAPIVIPHVAWAKKGDKAHKSDDDAADDAGDDGDDGDKAKKDDGDDDDAPKPKPKTKAKGEPKAKAKAEPKAKAKPKDEEEAAAGDDGEDASPAEPEAPAANRLPAKQDLTGHDLGSVKKANEFERDRFFVDKLDSEQTEAGTLIQGSLTSSTFAYGESGGTYPGSAVAAPVANSAFSRAFTDLRLQTDFRHIKASRWQARIDGRIRAVTSASEPALTLAPANPTIATTAAHAQSGLTGQNEYELRELWLVRNGERSDVTIGRQFIADLAAVKIDGVRIDYASTNKLTLLGFGGLYPLRGSRSLDTDYIALKKLDAATGQLVPAGKLVGSGGFGAAYRTADAYGAIGGVALVPLDGEQARIFATSNGYLRYGSKLDLYHFALIDLIGSNDALGGGKAGLTNLSGGVNFKPNPRLRMTASFNRVDTETLNVQANAFLSQPDAESGPAIQNELYVTRLSTDQVRGSISAGLGELQRFEVTVASAFRYRPAFTLKPSVGTDVATLNAAEGVEVYGSVTDRRSIKDARLGFDVVKTFGVGSIAYQRTDVTAFRGFAAHEIKNGQGEWEGELSYATTKDSGVSTLAMCNPGGGITTNAQIPTCYGATTGSIISLGGTLYYRFNRDWFGLASLFLNHTTLQLTGKTADPSINGLTGYARIGYRF